MSMERFVVATLKVYHNNDDQSMLWHTVTILILPIVRLVQAQDALDILCSR